MHTILLIYPSKSSCCKSNGSPIQKKKTVSILPLACDQVFQAAQQKQYMEPTTQNIPLPVAEELEATSLDRSSTDEDRGLGVDLLSNQSSYGDRFTARQSSP
jgi:hypothetical protein